MIEYNTVTVTTAWSKCGACVHAPVLLHVCSNNQKHREVESSESQTDRVRNTNSACDCGAHDLVKTISSIRASKVYPSRLHALIIWILNLLAVSLQQLVGLKFTNINQFIITLLK